MSTVNGTIENDPNATYPDGTAAVGLLLTLTETTTGAQVKQTAAIGATSISVVVTVPGTYAGTISLVDADEAPIGPVVPADATIVVPTAPVTITIATPTKLTLSVA